MIVSWYVKSSSDMWNEVRKILKHFKWRIYYNRIPFIVHQLTRKNSVSWTKSYDQYQEIITDFKRICYVFDQKREELKRKYFPNMRFIALKLLEKHGVKLEYNIPFTRTSRKRKDLEYIWNILN
jgi:Poxvirus Late Transcription Factor VLTF3 like